VLKSDVKIIKKQKQKQQQQQQQHFFLFHIVSLLASTNSNIAHACRVKNWHAALPS
jgi:hypothetical protein